MLVHHVEVGFPGIAKVPGCCSPFNPEAPGSRDDQPYAVSGSESISELQPPPAAVRPSAVYVNSRQVQEKVVQIPHSSSQFLQTNNQNLNLMSPKPPGMEHGTAYLRAETQNRKPQSDRNRLKQPMISSGQLNSVFTPPGK